jgi:hypothetical protein
MNQSTSPALAQLPSKKPGVFSTALLDFAYPKLKQAHAIITYIEALFEIEDVDTADKHCGVECSIGIAHRLANEVANNHEHYAGVSTTNNPDFEWLDDHLYPVIGLMSTMQSSMWQGEAEFIADHVVVLNVIQVIKGALQKVLDELTFPTLDPDAPQVVDPRVPPLSPATAETREGRARTTPRAAEPALAA